MGRGELRILRTFSLASFLFAQFNVAHVAVHPTKQLMVSFGNSGSPVRSHLTHWAM